MNQKNDVLQRGRIVRAAKETRKTKLPLIGNIRVGMKNEKGLPVSLDHFIATGDYASYFLTEFGEKPTKVQIIFLSDENVQSCLEEWDGRDPKGKRAGYGNGETFSIYDEEFEGYVEMENQETIKKLTKEKKITWKVLLTLHFVIPKIKGVFGLWRFQTRGDKTSIASIVSTFDEIKNNIGTIVNIPFDLIVKKVKSQTPGSIKVFPVVSLVPNLSTDNIELVRKYLECGMDFSRLGVLTAEKIKQLDETSPTDKLVLRNPQ